MKISYRSVLLWGLAALVCIFLLSMRTYAGEAGPGAGLPEYSNNHGGILYQGDPKNETGDAVGSADTSGVITDDPEMVHQVLLGEDDRDPGFLELMRYMLK